MGNEINIKIQKCSNWDGGTIYYWKTLEHYFEIYSSNDIYKKYKIFSRYDEMSQWINVGWMEFWKTTAPDCPNANNNYCGSTTHHLPDWNLNIHPDDENYAHAQKCEDEEASGTVTNNFVEADSGKEWNLNDFNLNSFDACFNKDTQKWQFNFTNPQDFEMHWIVDYCEEVMADYDVLISIDDVNCERIPFFAWQFARNCFEKNKYWSGFNDDDYLIFEVLEAHEQKHVEQLQGLMYSGLLAEFYQKTGEWELKNCESFNSYTDAKNKALAAFKKIFADMQNKFVGKVTEFENSWEKIARRERIKIVNNYIVALVELICP